VLKGHAPDIMQLLPRDSVTINKTRLLLPLRFMRIHFFLVLLSGLKHFLVKQRFLSCTFIRFLKRGLLEGSIFDLKSKINC